MFVGKTHIQHSTEHFW